MAGIKISELDAATSLAGTELIPITQGAGNKSLTPFFLNGNVYNVKWFGATGNGTTDDSAAVQAVITAAIAAGKAVYFPAGTYLVTGLTVAGALTIFGDGNQSIIKTTTNNVIFNVTADGFRMYDLKIIGNDTGTSEIGVRINTVKDYLISRCTFYNLGGIGINCYGIVITNSIPSSISDCNFSTCRTGIKVENRHEYVNLTNNLVSQCDYAGMWLLGGNFNITGGSITKNSIGIYMTSGTNDSHSSISNVLINHNTTGLMINGILYGLVFSACQFHSNTYIHLINTLGILFNGCEFGSNTIRLENSETHFANYVDMGGNTVVNDYNTTTSHTLWSGKTTVGETNPIFRIQAETDAGSALVMTNKTGDEKYRLYANGTQKIAQLTGALTDGAPSDTEIDTITGLTPATAGAGWRCTILDNNGTGLLYMIESDGTNWQYVPMIIAT